MTSHKLRKLILPLTVAVLAMAGLTFFLGGYSQTAVAQTDEQPSQSSAQRTLTVSGQGQVMVQPDMATVNLGVETEADTAVDALDQNNEQMQQVISTTLDADIAEADIQTQGLSLNPVYNQPTNGGSAELTGYRARNVVQITVRDLDNLGTLLDDIVSAGGNTIEGIQFQVSDRADQEANARAAAMENARQKATQLADLADADLGPIITINETGFSAPTPYSANLAAAESVAVPVQAGTQTINYSLNVTW
ncbi:MAG: SIMPL domain-containing protein, partial [Anaerolineales bacterium]|nr:SIMPL domain-containing protein [Anaerolineales bacterium]